MPLGLLFSLLSLPGAYAVAAMLRFCGTISRPPGMPRGPVRELIGRINLLWPLFRALLIGYFPAAIVSNQISVLAPEFGQLELGIALLGTSVSGVLMHRAVLAAVSDPVRANWFIAVVTLIMSVGFGTLIHIAEVSQ